ncbi:hypothetical protein WKV53_14010 [Luteolibacter sp. Y139]|uniref:Uncharacterized protein n=2 Tax=Luteolibacter soli TaxID=3135280 RepID=A0ABU9AV42_9BACT
MVSLFLWNHSHPDRSSRQQPATTKQNAPSPDTTLAAAPGDTDAPTSPALQPEATTQTTTPPVAQIHPTSRQPLTREMDPSVNPYAPGLHHPGKSKRAWDPAFIETFRDAMTDDPVSFELTGGTIATGTVKMVQLKDGIVSYVSGELTAPETGKFFILTPPVGGKAGLAVAVVEFHGSETAYRVEPTGPDGAPELWQRDLDEVVCLAMAEADPHLLAEEAAEAAQQPEEIAPLRPDLAPDYNPSYNSGIVSLQSLPGAQGVMLLDFAGGYTPTWGGITYDRPPVGNATIKDIWKRIAEDYAPFNINVTTDFKVFEAAPAASRQRCCFTTTPVTAAGVAYGGSWNWGNDTVCWSVYYVGKAAAEVASHEVGHTLGLAHQGQTGGVEYYGGQGSGQTGWAPIMGVGYYQPVTTWAKGEYLNANQPQDELLTVTTTNNNVAYRNDDTGSTLAASRYLDVNADNTVTAEGIIERTGDTDAFQFTTTGGAVNLTVNPVAPGDWGDLATMATIANSSDTVIATTNSQNSVSSTISTTLAAGTYTFRVTGVGKNNPLSDGFTDYASLGYYAISGSVAGARQPTRLSVQDHAANNTTVGTVPANNPNSSPLVYTITSGNTGTTFSIDNSGVVRVASNTLLDYYALASNPALYNARFELFVTITNTNNSAYTETNRRVLVDVTKFLPPVPAYVTAKVDTGSRATITWTCGPDATSFNVKRSTSPGGPFTTIATTSYLSYTDTALSNGVTYYYVVSGVNVNGESANSAVASVSAQSIAGYSFEAPAIGNFAYNPSGGFWTFSAQSGNNGSGIVANGSGFGNPNAPHGSQAGFVQALGTITQTISGFVPGTTYVINYAAAQRGGAAQHGGETWNVTIDGTTIQTNNTPGATSYTGYTTSFVASATTHTLAFAGTNLNGDDNTVFIDNVQITVTAPVASNNSFETPSLGASHQYNPSGASWTFTGQSGIAGNGSAFNVSGAPMGTQVAFVQSAGSIAQTLTGFTVGRTYVISYSSAQRPGNAQTWNVQMGSTVIESGSGGGSGFTTHAINFTAAATSYSLSFVGTNLNGGDNTVFIDNVTITSPPVSAAAAIALTSPSNNSTFYTPASLNLQSTVTANGTLINGVQYYADNFVLIGQNNTAPYNVTWPANLYGQRSITARVLFNNGSSADSLPVAVNIINRNLDFETPSLGTGGGAYQYNSAGGSWTFTAASGNNGSGLAGNGSAFGNPNAPGGTQVAFLQGTGTITQTMGGFTPNTGYRLNFKAAQRSGNAQTWTVKFDGTTIGTYNPGSGATTFADYTTSTFITTSTTHTITFTGTNQPGGDNTIFLDNLVFEVVPPPAAPTGLTATAGNTSVALSWSASAGATSYNVKRATTSGGPYTTVGNVASPGFNNTSLTNYTTYYYVVTALGEGGESTASGQASATPIIIIADPGFASPALAAGAFQYNPTGGSWTFSGASPSGSGLVSNGSGFSNPNAPEGTQAAFVQEYGTMSQAITGLTVGNKYTITFAAAQRSGANQHGGESWNLKMDSTLIASYNPGPAATSYVDYTATFVATAATQTLTFVGTDLATGDNTVFIDNVRIALNTATLPSPWARQDIGVTNAAGSASHSSGVFTLNGAGTNVDGTSDSFSFLSQSSSADCSITVRVASLVNTNPNAKSGVMIRESLAANARELGVWVTPANGIIFTRRTTTGGTTATSISTGKAAPYWVRLTRTGNVFAAYYSANGTTWTQLGSNTTVAMTTTAYLGLGSESGDANQIGTTTIDNVTAVP